MGYMLYEDFINATSFNPQGKILGFKICEHINLSSLFWFKCSLQGVVQHVIIEILEQALLFSI